jgi:ureidoacrylate peracid hydrolase
MSTKNAPTGRVVTIEAKPEPIPIDAAKTAVLVIDMQNDFGSNGGMFDRAGIDISGIQKAVGPTAQVIASAQAAGRKIAYLKMGYRADLSDQGAPDSVNRVRHLRLNVGKVVRAPDGRESRILIRDTWKTDILPCWRRGPAISSSKRRGSAVSTRPTWMPGSESSTSTT